MSRFLSSPCLACGDACGGPPTNAAHWSGNVGPFCSEACRNKQQDVAVWSRANAYAARVEESLKTMTRSDYSTPTHQPFETSDVARAFVIGYAAALEMSQGVGRRTVKK